MYIGRRLIRHNAKAGSHGRKRRRLMVAMTGMCVSLGLSGCASLPRATILSDAQRVELARASAYLNELHRFSANFVQTGYFGAGQGQVWVSRPGKLRLRYGDGLAKDMVANHGVIEVRDLANGSVTTMRLSRSPINLLLASQIDLAARAGVASVTSADAGLVVKVYDPQTPAEGTLTLGFRRHPLTLTFVQAQDLRGRSFTLQLTDITPQAAVPPGTFVLPEG